MLAAQCVRSGHVYMKKSLPLRKEGETAATGADTLHGLTCLNKESSSQAYDCQDHCPIEGLIFPIFRPRATRNAVPSPTSFGSTCGIQPRKPCRVGITSYIIHLFVHKDPWGGRGPWGGRVPMICLFRDSLQFCLLLVPVHHSRRPSDGLWALH